MKIGYMRVSTEKQDHALQHDALIKAGCEKIFTDTISGKSINRLGLDACMSILAEGDTLVVWKLDRLGRKVSHLSRLIEELQERKISFSAIMDNFDTSTVAGRAMLGMMMVFAQMERETISERVTAGLAVRRANGGKLGPPFKIDNKIRQRIYDMDGVSPSQLYIAKELKISQSMVSRVLKEKNNDSR